jgi:hypothetical protein
MSNVGSPSGRKPFRGWPRAIIIAGWFMLAQSVVLILLMRFAREGIYVLPSEELGRRQRFLATLPVALILGGPVLGLLALSLLARRRFPFLQSSAFGLLLMAAGLGLTVAFFTGWL